MAQNRMRTTNWSQSSFSAGVYATMELEDSGQRLRSLGGSLDPISWKRHTPPDYTTRQFSDQHVGMVVIASRSPDGGIPA